MTQKMRLFIKITCTLAILITGCFISGCSSEHITPARHNSISNNQSNHHKAKLKTDHN